MLRCTYLCLRDLLQYSEAVLQIFVACSKSYVSVKKYVLCNTLMYVVIVYAFQSSQDN